MQSVGQHSPAPHPLHAFAAVSARVREWIGRLRTETAQRPSLLLTVLGILGVGGGLSIAALLSHDPREAGAYAVACLMIGGTMALGGWARQASPQDALPQHVLDLRNEVEAVAHDLKAPLVSISSYLELVASGAFGSVSDEAAQTLRRAAQLSERAQSVVAAALGTDTVDTPADTSPVARLVPLDRTISEVATALTPVLREREASLTVEGTLPSVRGDDAALFRVFENLIQNAIKFCPDGRSPHVRIQAHRIDATTIEVTVADNGCGFPSQPAVLIERGTRGANAAGIAGHGLGLATVARLIAQMHGTLSFDPTPEGGTMARVTLPAA